MQPGQVFGEWTALRPVGTGGLWLARCSCGFEAHVRGCDMRAGRSTQCKRHETRVLIGKRFGLLAVVDIAERKKVVCSCDCGGRRTLFATQLTSGQSTCCGCTLKVKMSAVHRTHGMGHTPTWKTWMSMRERVAGGSPVRTRAIYEGMELQPEWALSFEAFLADMGERPPGTSLDRIDGSKGYIRGNCRWADIRTQNQNRKGCIEIEIDGERLNAAEFSRRFGVKYTTVLKRVRRGLSGRAIIGKAAA